MQLLLHALLVAVLVPAFRASPAAPEPKCSAHLSGPLLLTAIEFPDGYRISAPWAVVSTQHLVGSGDLRSIVAELELSELTETDAITRQTQSRKLASPVRLRLQAPTDEELVFQAAETWCSTVIQARQGSPTLPRLSAARPGRVT